VSFPARTVALFNNLVPRISAIYDLFGNTKTALKFNYGRYAEDPDITLVNSVNPNSVIITNRYAWDGTLPITPELVARSRLLETVGQLTPVTINPDLTNAYTDQWLVGAEHTLARDLAVAANWVRMYRYNTRDTVNRAQPTSGYVPVSAIDPGPDGLVSTGDDRPFTVYERLVPAGSDLYLTNFDSGEYYNTIEISATKRFSNGGQFVTGWDTTTRHLGDSISLDPNQRIYNGDNRVVTKQWTYKIVGNYALPWSSSVSGSYSVQKGEPYNRTVQFTPALLVNHPGALAQGNTTVAVEPSSHYYRPNVHLSNIRYEKTFRRTASRRLTTLFELYNITNSNVVIGTNSVTGRTTDRNGKNVPSFDRVTQILSPRIFRIGVRVDF
jgi:hypothetical protein